MKSRCSDDTDVGQWERAVQWLIQDFGRGMVLKCQSHVEREAGGVEVVGAWGGVVPSPQNLLNFIFNWRRGDVFLNSTCLPSHAKAEQSSTFCVHG